MAVNRSELRFLIYSGAIFACYFLFGMLQEKITRGKYGNNDKFTCALSLVLVQCVVNYIFAQILMLSWKHEKDTTRKIYYFSSALTYLIAMICSTMALQWINYPTQVVGKAAKPIPVMILGVLVGRKTYPLRKYLFVLLIVVGVVLFMYKDQGKNVNAESSLGIGEVLLLLSLTMDGLTGAVQERIKTEHSPTAYSMMLNTNGWSSIIVSVGVILSGEIFTFIRFVSQYPEVLGYVTALALTGAVGQLFIFYMVSEFGPLPCSVVTTTRKFFTVLASVIIFGNVLGVRQWMGAVLVFSGLFLDIFYSKGKGHAPKKTEEKLIKDCTPHLALTAFKGSNNLDPLSEYIDLSEQAIHPDEDSAEETVGRNHVTICQLNAKTEVIVAAKSEITLAANSEVIVDVNSEVMLAPNSDVMLSANSEVVLAANSLLDVTSEVMLADHANIPIGVPIRRFSV